MNFFDTDGLPGKDLAEVDFLAAETDAPTAGHHDGFIVEGIVDVRQSGVGARGRLVDLRGKFHVQGFVRTFVVEDVGRRSSLCLSAAAAKIVRIVGS